MRKSLFVLAVLLALSSVVFSAPGENKEISAAREAATAWVSKLDANQFSECWDRFSTDSKKAVPRWIWNIQCKMGRSTLGKARSRVEKSAERSSKSPGGRTGEFVLFTYETSSEKKGLVIERVPVQKDHDKEWRVCGYSIGQTKQ